MNKILLALIVVSMFGLSGCGMKRALTQPDNKKMADEKDLMEF